MSDQLINTLIAILFALGPTLIVGLTRYPRVVGVAQLVWRVLNALALATHIDSPGTFKPPLTMSRQPTEEGTP